MKADPECAASAEDVVPVYELTECGTLLENDSIGFGRGINIIAFEGQNAIVEDNRSERGAVFYAYDMGS